MSGKQAPLDKAYVEKKHAQLTRMREQFINARKAKQGDDASLEADAQAGAQEYEDDAQKLAMLELDGNLEVRDEERLARVDRALQKIADGTYGFSDASGDAIPRERLDAVPDALYTVKEQDALEKR